MTGHFLWLLGCSARNRLRQQIRRLRQPRYAVALVLGFAYFLFLFGGGGTGRGDRSFNFLDAGRSIGPLMMGALAAWWWLWGGHRFGLVLTPAETHMLVPAPLARRALVRFKILQAQLALVLSAILGTVLTRGGPLPWPLRVLSLWALLATLHQHQIAASLVHSAAEQQGRRGVRRHLLPLALFTAGFLAMTWAVGRAVWDIRAQATFAFAMERLGALMAEPIPRVVLAPFRLLLAPVLAPTVADWAPAFVLALAVLGLHYLWIQRTDTAFEEEAAAIGEKRATQLAAVRAGGAGRLRFTREHRPPRLAAPLLPLRMGGRPAFAIFWKNVLYSQRQFRLRTILVVGAIMLAVLSPTLLAGGGSRPGIDITGFGVLALGGFMTFFGPFMVRNDLRMDLVNVQTLRTYPLAGRDVVLAAIASATVIICLFVAPFLLAGMALLLLAGTFGPLSAAAILLVALLALPVVTALSVTIQNAIALMYPGWTRIGPSDSGGMEAVGQNMLIMIGTVVLLALTMIPPALVAIAVGAPLTLVTPAVAIPVAGAAALATAGAEVLLLSRWLGRVYDRTDPVAAGLLR